MEFWNDRTTSKSWEVLIKLNKKLDFILIGGWATYLHTKAVKSKDIDLIVDFETLVRLKEEYGARKNYNLKKYEAIIKGVDVDIYVPYFSEFVIPTEDLEEYTEAIEGIKVLKAEPLMILKQEAEKERAHSVKGQKDRTDILNLLLNADIDFESYSELLEKYDLLEFKKRLLKIIRGAKKEFHYLGIENPRKIKLKKEELIKNLRNSS